MELSCREIIYSGHAVRRLFERSLNIEDVVEVIRNGVVVADYPDDRPFPSTLLLGFVGSVPLHLVVAFDIRVGRCHIVTAYVPDAVRWSEDFKTRRS